jgi:hypothetical protein
MRPLIAVLTVSLFSLPAFAAKPCDELKTEIAAKLDAKGVKGYDLGILAAADVKDQTVIGTCEGGAKKITYTKGAQPAGNESAPKKSAEKPAAAPQGK